jgi:hypothetical protein
MSVKFTGNYDKTKSFVDNLDSSIKKGLDLSIKKVGLKAESMAVKHMRDQDLGWKPLSQRYLARTLKFNKSEKTMISTEGYWHAITTKKTDKGVFIGVLKGEKNEDGNEIAKYAAINEFGSTARNIPARPLWQPVLSELREWIKTSKVIHNEVKNQMI